MKIFQKDRKKIKEVAAELENLLEALKNGFKEVNEKFKDTF